jgi:hypothetical protein
MKVRRESHTLLHENNVMCMKTLARPSMQQQHTLCTANLLLQLLVLHD